jgi:hypothetical protein
MTDRWEGEGVVLRATPRGAVQQWTPSGHWVALRLRRMARRWPVGEGPWPWLLAHGVRRPSPSGASGTAIARSARQRRGVELTLGDEARARLDALAVGSTRSAVVESLILRVPLNGKTPDQP